MTRVCFKQTAQKLGILTRAEKAVGRQNSALLFGHKEKFIFFINESVLHFVKGSEATKIVIKYVKTREIIYYKTITSVQFYEKIHFLLNIDHGRSKLESKVNFFCFDSLFQNVWPSHILQYCYLLFQS